MIDRLLTQEVLIFVAGVVAGGVFSVICDRVWRRLLPQHRLEIRIYRPQLDNLTKDTTLSAVVRNVGLSTVTDAYISLYASVPQNKKLEFRMIPPRGSDITGTPSPDPELSQFSEDFRDEHLYWETSLDRILPKHSVRIEARSNGPIHLMHVSVESNEVPQTIDQKAFIPDPENVLDVLF